MYTYLASAVILLAVLCGQIIGLHSILVTWPIFHVVMHVMGGVGIALFASAVINSGLVFSTNRRRFVIWSALAAGLLWEAIETYYNITGFQPWTHGYYVDAVKDLIYDAIGGIVVAWLYWRRSPQP